MRRVLRPIAIGLLSATLLPQSGCAVFSPAPLWEVAKAAGMVASRSLAPSRASHTVYQPHDAFTQLCIELNRASQVADIVPALQAEFSRRQIRSRVLEAGSPPGTCPVWLRYTAYLQWDKPMMDERYQPYVTAATLTLFSPHGQILSSSSYDIGGSLGTDKWASTRQKLSPVVTALLTGVDTEGSKP